MNNINQIKIESLADYANEIGVITNTYNQKNQIIISISETLTPVLHSSSSIIENEIDNNQKKYDQYSKDYYQIFDDNENSFFYRGQANIDFANKVCPSIYRSTEKHNEKYYMNNLDVRCFSELIDKQGISKLTYLQH